MSRIILDLCAGTGAWSKPYLDRGYDVRRYDLPNDIRLLERVSEPIRGILAAPPCTCFSFARNRYPPTQEQLLSALSVVDACLRLVFAHQPMWWALENPRAKLRRYLGPPQFEFKQYEFGDPGVKPTCLWGRFTHPKKTPGIRTKPSTFKTNIPNASPKDAMTPPGFALAFCEANP